MAGPGSRAARRGTTGVAPGYRVDGAGRGQGQTALARLGRAACRDGYHKRLATLAVVLLAAACSDPVPPLPPLPPDGVVLAFGDSLTRGTGAGEAEAFPARLEALIGRRVVNAGVPGEVSAEGLRRLPGTLDRHRPDLLILCHGGNDFLRKRPEAALEANLREMVAVARERGVPVVLIGVPAPGIFLSTAEVYRRVAADLALPLEADVVGDVLGDPALKSDPIHPNAAGYARLAAAVASLLREAGAVP